VTFENHTVRLLEQWADSPAFEAFFPLGYSLYVYFPIFFTGDSPTEYDRALFWVMVLLRQ
jgi:hypothetical protein